jgi:pyruvate kinase
MKKTKIVCTLGPATDKRAVLKRLVNEGMDVARLNLSHGDKSTHKNYIDVLRGVDGTIPIIADLKGAEIRVRGLKKPISIKKNGIFRICSNENCIPVSYKNVHSAVKKGSLILLDDGLIKLRVVNVKKKIVFCKALNTNILKDNKKVTIPGANFSIKFPSKADIEDIKFALRNNIEFLALSFVKSKSSVLRVKRLVRGSKIKIITKIETTESVKNFEEILKVSDGIMIARGDLGVELPPEDVPYIQKFIIKECNKAGKPVITATQMLESMIYNPLPTRAETADVANAILDGTDAVMLSGESAVGKFPVESVNIMKRIANKIENSVRHNVELNDETISQNISRAAYYLSKSKIVDKVIVTTARGFTARMIAKFRPKKALIAVTHDNFTRNQLRLVWGVMPIVFTKKINHTHDTTYEATKDCSKKRLVNLSDHVVITGGLYAGEAGHTNLIEIHKVKELLSLYSK